MIKPGSELSDMTQEALKKHLKYHVQVIKEPSWLKTIGITLFYALFMGALFFFMWEGF